MAQLALRPGIFSAIHLRRQTAKFYFLLVLSYVLNKYNDNFQRLSYSKKKLIQHAPLHEIIIFRKLKSVPSYLLPPNVPVEIVQQGLILILLSNPCLSRAATHKYPGTFSTFLAINIDDRGFEGRK